MECKIEIIKNSKYYSDKTIKWTGHQVPKLGQPTGLWELMIIFR